MFIADEVEVIYRSFMLRLLLILPAGALPATLSFDSSSDMLNFLRTFLLSVKINFFFILRRC
jgi:hypothetical protein